MRRLWPLLLLLPVLAVTVRAAPSIYIVSPDTDVMDFWPSGDLPGEPPMSEQLPADLPLESPIQITGGVPDEGDIPAIDIETYTLEPITPSNTTGLKKVLLSVLGNYESIVTDYRYQNFSGNWQYLREIQPDYVWLCSAAVFALLLWCTFRMAGGIFSCRR